ncbi:MAG TPA: DUF1134 domain-containing protein [Allosphingosinicella sp.]|jgi:hypothetical protein|nr:DUF1134 domain-containing protein [Allosphingosinicella sp.]
MLKIVVKFAAAAALFGAGPALAQIRNVDPSRPDSWQQEAEAEAPAQADGATPDEAAPEAATSGEPRDWTPIGTQGAAAPGEIYATPSVTAAAPGTTLPREDVFTAAEGLFGRGARGLAGILENILRDQGEPIAYITGQEASGAFMIGVRYGSGVMHHSIEGDRNVYWTGPSIGFDVGGDVNKVFVLVYNLHDSQELFRRFPGGEGHAYFVGGFSATYLRRGDVVLIPVRLGGGLRLGVNVGYMRFSERNRWLPF